MAPNDRTRPRRLPVLAAAGLVLAGILLTIFLAPVERAALLVSLIAPVLAAVLAAVAVEWWKRRRT
ncbi:hypothetical protein ACN6LF_004658 [[Kitasatospora] papulosa]|uniref:hypothetical protein n=1 Tax=Streptomyces TaxID=1883 RepID=UPI002272C617|nr:MULTISPECIES: hypothetical protein [unclassified Streptomyces]MCY1649279.1 hypothetical protein [Streptomyces sp. SL203]MCY1676992.1 hypothetical protein [Streptomyces sp. SL294]